MKVLLSSGGMDSFLLADRLGPMVKHVFVNVGQEYNEKELAAAKRVAQFAGAQLYYMDGANIAHYSHPTGIIPYRNAELILCAAQHGHEIYLGVIGDEINSDKSPEFIEAMRVVLDISHRKQYWTDGKQHRIYTPLRNETKSELVGEYLGSHGNSDAARHHLLDTVSCYAGDAVHCGRCGSCFKRWVALANNGLGDAQPWLEKPWRAFPASEWQRKFEEIDCTYSMRRIGEISSAYATVGIRLV